MKELIENYITQPWPREPITGRRKNVSAMEYQDALAFVETMKYVRVHSKDTYFEEQLAKLRGRPTRQCFNRHVKEGVYCAAIITHHRVDYYDSGLLGSAVCKFCDALLLKSEDRKNRVSMCCGNGSLHTLEMQYDYNELQNPPEAFLRDLLQTPNEHLRQEFLSNTRVLNNNFAFASVHAERAPIAELGSRLDTCKYNGDFSFLYYDLEPPVGCTPKFAQIYTLDPDEAIEERTQNIQNAIRIRISPAIIRILEPIIRQSPLGRTFTCVWDKVKEVEAQTGNVPLFRIILLSSQQLRELENLDNCANFTVIERSDAPTANQVAVVWVSDEGLPPEFPGVWICDHAGRERPLWNNSPHLEPSCFPLLRLRGTPGWRLHIKKNMKEPERVENIDENQGANVEAHNDVILEDLPIDAEVDNEDMVDQDQQIQQEQEEENLALHSMVDMESHYDDQVMQNLAIKGPRENISQRQFIRYQMQIRSPGRDDFHWLWYSRKLAEYYTIAQLNRVERNELEYVKKIQRDKNYRKMLANELVEAIEKGLQRKFGGKLGQIFLMPKTFPGSTQYFNARYADLMTMVQHLGNPDLFITFTGNPNWPEIQAMLPKGQEWTHRPDIVCRVFMDKEKEFLKDVTERGIFGKVKGWCYSVEHQKRGMPHLHMLLFLHEDSKWKIPEEIDRYICARIPPLPPMDDDSVEAKQQRRLWYTVVTHMIHSCSSKYCLDENGRCRKFFPKPFTDQAIISEDRYTEYVRLFPSHREEEFEEFEDTEMGPSMDFAHHIAVRYKRFRPPQHKTKNWNTEGLEYVYKMRGQTAQKLNDSHVVPYNPFLSLKYGCHINLEYVFGQLACKYIFKYILKGFDKGYVKVQKAKNNVEANGEPVYDYDEISSIFRVRFMTAPEAFLRLHSCAIVKMSHEVKTLPVHEERGQTIVWDPDHEEELANRINRDTQLTGFFKLCQHDEFARTLTYVQLPYYYSWDRRLRMWTKRVHQRDDNMDTTDLYVRMYTVTPKRHELLAIRTLLMNVPGPTSFDDLQSVDVPGQMEKQKCISFTEAAQKRGLLASDAMQVEALEDACIYYGVMQRQQLWRYFAMLIHNAPPENPRELFDNFLDKLFPQPPVNVSQGSRRQPLSRDYRRNYVMKNLEYYFRIVGSSCSQAGLGNAPADYNHELQEELIEGEFLTNEFYGPNTPMEHRRNPKRVALEQIAKLNEDQRAIFDEITLSIRGLSRQKFFDIQGYGGCGKTFLFEALIRWMLAGKPSVEANASLPKSVEAHSMDFEYDNIQRLERSSVFATASTGIAALLLIGGTTVHSAFYVPNNVKATTTPKINNESVGAERFRNADLIIIDEESMLHNRVFTYIDRLLKEVCACDQPFGGKVVITGGDWHQLPPVVPGGSRSDLVRASIKSCPLFKDHFKTLRLTKNMRTDPGEISFREWLLKIGQGRDENGNKTGTVEIPEANTATSLDALIDYCFPKNVLAKPLEHTEELCSSAILCPRNVEATAINEKILREMDGIEHKCESLDTPLMPDVTAAYKTTFRADYNIETLNSMMPTGLPPHVLRLKVGAPVMLIRNLDQRQGLCNGTRLQVVRVTAHNVVCKIATGPRKGQDVLLPQVRFEYDGESGQRDVRFTRLQFPLRLCFAMTINKAQGQTLKRMGLALQSMECFSHGQVYTAISRVTCQDGFRVFSIKHVLGQTLKVLNPVYYELLDD